MSDTSSLSELANLVSSLPLEAEGSAGHQRVVNAAAAGVRPRPQRHGVGDLLATVLVLSARTRRLVLPRVEIELDVFAPDGKRALRLLLPR